MKQSLSFAFLALAGLPLVAAAEQIPGPPKVEARSFVLFDYQSGQVLAEHEAHARVEPASITKVMTTYVAFEEMKNGHVKADDQVLISEKAWRQGKDSSESRMFIEVGKRVSLEDLLHGIIIQSGNDASVAVAEHIAGDESVFAELMNKTAARLGMKNSHFDNAPGLPSPNLYTTAYDVALLSQAIIRDFPEGYALFKQREFVFNGIKQQNRNMLLDMDPTADGIKTGHTSGAGYCLAASAIRDGRRLIAVVMGADGPGQRARAVKALLDYGFRFYETAQVLGPDKPVAEAKVWKGASGVLPAGTLQPVALSLPRGQGSRLKFSPEVLPRLIAPIQQGQKIGTVTITLDGKPLRTEPLVALKPIVLGSWWDRLIDTILLWFED